MGEKDVCQGTLEDTKSISDISYVLGQGNFIIIGKKLQSLKIDIYNMATIQPVQNSSKEKRPF